jgi:hypothetical protein
MHAMTLRNQLEPRDTLEAIGNGLAGQTGGAAAVDAVFGVTTYDVRIGLRQ